MRTGLISLMVVAGMVAVGCGDNRANKGKPAGGESSGQTGGDKGGGTAGITKAGELNLKTLEDGKLVLVVSKALADAINPPAASSGSAAASTSTSSGSSQSGGEETGLLADEPTNPNAPKVVQEGKLVPADKVDDKLAACEIVMKKEKAVANAMFAMNGMKESSVKDKKASVSMEDSSEKNMVVNCVAPGTKEMTVAEIAKTLGETLPLMIKP